MKKKSVCDHNVFSSIYETNVKDLHNYLFYKFGDRESVEDVVQESFIKLWEKCVEVIFSKVRSYLFTIASNLYIDKKRHKKIIIDYNKNQFNSDINNQNPEFILQEKEFMVKLQDTIGSLPDKQREVFLLNRIDKKTYREISEMLGISVKAVEKRMHNALKVVRKEIGNI